MQTRLWSHLGSMRDSKTCTHKHMHHMHRHHWPIGFANKKDKENARSFFSAHHGTAYLLERQDSSKSTWMLFQPRAKGAPDFQQKCAPDSLSKSVPHPYRCPSLRESYRRPSTWRWTCLGGRISMDVLAAFVLKDSLEIRWIIPKTQEISSSNDFAAKLYP